MKICIRGMPPYTVIKDGHYSACWLLQKKQFEHDGEKSG
jgi:oligopeptide transport system ATP-binding protein